MDHAMKATFVKRQTQLEELTPFKFIGRNFTDFNNNLKCDVDFYDCKPVLWPDYESPVKNEMEIVKKHIVGGTWQHRG